MAFELTREYVEQLLEAVENRHETFIRETLDELYPADIANLLYDLEDEQAKYVLTLLDRDVSAEVITNLDPYRRTDFLAKFTSEELAGFVDHIESDDAADILNEQPGKTREEVIALLENREKARYIIDLLHYEEDTAGGLMAKELVKCNINWTVVQCVDEIRRQAQQVEKVNSVYVVDDKGILKGRVSLKKIVLSRASNRVSDIYEDDVLSVELHQSAEEVADIMRRYDLESIPVVNVNGKLMGRITIDDVVDVITELAERERQAMSGLTGDAEEDEESIWLSVRARLPWLLIGMVGGLLAARFVGLFEDDLIAVVPALAAFIPLIGGTGGNVGIQSSSVILQSLANRSVFEISTVERLLKVLMIAVLNGLVLGVIVFAFNWALGAGLRLSLVVSIALLSVVLLSSFMGTVTPLVLDKFGINPAVASGPFITTANDLLGLTIYFLTAKLLYSI
ncbi:MAG: Mg/Co/Ni transporter MgtE, CBS domain-containing [uncultured Cytophagales bacterium]|uniref:Magnesium transporter MgtE n=1 Tax=uncultured Cytophagales bacterium TaxID=158755 RepID=A0A6J4J1K1_9SPHI|nr:MAG: Mg/Co/Ni transporter MgtE, CBS domain-containing [uncultured Cytophagales bacterium]